MLDVVAGNPVLEVYRGSGSPVDDLAFEAWMLDRAGAGQPCCSYSSWPGPVVVLGYGQSPTDVDLAWCREEGIPVLRRLTGGTGVVHRDDLGLALALPAAHPWAAGVVGLYDRFLEVAVAALRKAGAEVERKQDARRAARVRSPICFFDQLSDTLLVAGRKAVGCAQTRRRGAVLIHAAILLGLDAELYGRIFRTDPARVRQSLAPAISGGTWHEIGRALASALADALGLGWEASSVPQLPDRYVEVYRQPRWAPLIEPQTAQFGE
jgi:lipoate-protein ligase A